MAPHGIFPVPLECQLLMCMGRDKRFFKRYSQGKLYSVQEFAKMKSWLLLIFSTCLHNQLNSIKGTDVQAI